MATEKMDVPQKLLGGFLVLALVLGGGVALVSKIGQTVDPAGYASAQAHVTADAKTALDATTAADAEQARTQAAEDAKGREEAFIFAKAEETKDSVLANFGNPASATFRNVWAVRYQDAFVYCGEVAAQHDDGSYPGYEPFMALGKEAFLPENSPNFAEEYRLCKGTRIIAVPF